jgi:hypothetical protein
VEATITVQKVTDVVGTPRDVWLKAKMFDAELKNAGHAELMVTFIMDQGSNMDTSFKEMKTLISSCTKLFPIMLKSSEDGETSSSYSNLTPQDVVEIQKAATRGGNKHLEEEDQVEDITTLTAAPVYATQVVVPNATPVSSIVGNEILDGCHVVEVSPPGVSPRWCPHVWLIFRNVLGTDL